MTRPATFAKRRARHRLANLWRGSANPIQEKRLSGEDRDIRAAQGRARSLAMTDSARGCAAQPNADGRRCAQRAFRTRAWRLVFGTLGLGFVCVALALAGTFIP
jgi:hypothetical protein